MGHSLSWVFLGIHIVVLLLIDFLVLHKKNQIPSSRRAIFETLFFILNALLFSAIVYFVYTRGLTNNINHLTPSQSVIKYLTGYIIELALSVDNLFVIALIFSSYKVPKIHQHKLLFYGILGAIIFRAILIGVGLVLIHTIHQITIVFGLFLLYTAFKMLKKDELNEVPSENKGITKFFRISKNQNTGNFILRENGKLVFTSLFAALITIEFTDLLFALDSIPAIFAVTTDPFLVFSSNIFAIMGLRSLFFFLGNLLEKFVYLKYSVFAILIFVSIKLISANWVSIPEWFSLFYITISLGIGVYISILKLKEA